MQRPLAMRLGLAVLAWFALSGCAPLALWWKERNRPPVPQVLALPAEYDPAAPLPPYTGPHPAQLNWYPDPAWFPIAPGTVGPIDESLGPLQYPFACDTERSRLGPPLVDNQDGVGTAVYAQDVIVGYSKDCLVRTRIDLYYKSVEGERLLPYDADVSPDQIAVIEHAGGRVPFVVRIERGTLNRFIYVIALLVDPAAPTTAPDLSRWNGDLVYHFRGGVGIGKRQGFVSVRTALERLHGALAAGYAVVYSGGTRTGTHYNMLLAGHTAAMVKAQFEAAYGRPRATIGVGASGGAVQQYLIAQNHPGLLDALIPVYSYPDMITQTNWALDCELLEHYFDVTATDRRWRDQTQRTRVMGLAAANDADNRYARVDGWAQLRRLRLPRLPAGATECSKSWRGLSPLTNNPHYLTNHRRYALPVLAQERWSHWHDLRLIYGVDASGFANRTWGNEGVQYGLDALRHGDLTPAEFLHLNAHIGSWVPPAQMQPERFWVLSGPLADRDGLAEVSIWSAHNMQLNGAPAPRRADFVPGGSNLITPAPRSRPDPGAVAAAFRSGQVYLGRANVPTLDVRHYLDPKLDMHHSFASLSTRARMQAAGNGAAPHAIWVAEPGFELIENALAAMAQWIDTDNPTSPADACFERDGRVIAAGADVWDGAWNGAPNGACTQRFPPHRSPRHVAGEPFAGDYFECPLQSMERALAGDLYAPVDMTPYRAYLAQIFPHGVCDYTQPEPGRPTWQELLGSETAAL